jgi:Undecaprenyl-phosphate glucose phosphotransferase
MGADLLAVSLAWILAYWFRFLSGFIEVDKGVPEFTSYLSQLLIIWVIWAFTFKKMKMYQPMRGKRRIWELLQLGRATVLAVLILIAVTYLFREKSVPFSRLVFLYFGVLAFGFTLAHRLIIRGTLQELRRKGYNLRYLLVVGTGKVAGDLITRVRRHRELGIQIVGCLAKDRNDTVGPVGAPVLGDYSDLKKLLTTMDIDQVVIALPLEDNHFLPRIMEDLRNSTVDVKIVPDVYQFISAGGSIEEFEGLPVISVQESPIEGVNMFLKRMLDVVISLTSLIVLSPLLALIALLVKLTSKGPILYVQERVSLDGTRFPIYKFRTMRVDAEKEGPQWSTKSDPRITPVGKFLRSWSLDELPQLWNVLAGHMSIVGPRPERPYFIHEFKEKIPLYMLRHKVPAGITGWAQVNGWRGDTSLDKRIEYDLYYLKNWSLFFDLKIIFLTLVKGLKDRSTT